MKSFYNRLVVFLLVSIALVACGKQYEAEAALGGGTSIHNHSGGLAGGGNLNLSGTLASSKACDSGYTRINTNFCSRDVAGSPLAIATSCTTLTLTSYGITSAVKGLALMFEPSVQAGTVVGTYQIAASVYSENACAVLLPGGQNSGLWMTRSENTASVSLFKTRQVVTIQTTAAIVYSKYTTVISGCTGCVGSLNAYVVGYYD